MEDSDGNDALVLTLDFTNNSKDSGSYVWSISETAIQNGAELAIATVFANKMCIRDRNGDGRTDGRHECPEPLSNGCTATGSTCIF